MMKHIFSKFAFCILLVWLCSCNQGTEQKPNVLFIAVDDLRPELNCYGQSQIISPNIDKLAAKGMVFTRSYCNQAVCMPSRASLFSGYRPDTLGIFKGGSLLEYAPSVLTLNQYFKNNGYQIGAYGKLYHHREDHKNQFGSIWSDTSRYSPNYGRNYVSLQNIQRMDETGRAYAWECIDVPDNAYKQGDFTEQAILKLKEFKNSTAPFFLGVGFNKPHLPFNAPQKYWDLYNPDEISLPENYSPIVNATPYTLNDFGELKNYLNIPDVDVLSDSLALKLIHGYYACVSYTDALIGKLLSALEENGFADNTIIILWGDHGWKLGEHLGWCKHTALEIDLHTPLIVSVPNMEHKGSKTSALVEHVDIYPTLCELCGLNIPKHVQGNSFAPVLENPEIPWKEAAYSIWPHSRTDDEKRIMGYSVTTKNYRYTEWYKDSNDSLVGRELYDHVNDPLGNVNVFGSEEYINISKEMKTLLNKKWHKLRDAR